MEEVIFIYIGVFGNVIGHAFLSYITLRCLGLSKLEAEPSRKGIGVDSADLIYPTSILLATAFFL